MCSDKKELSELRPDALRKGAKLVLADEPGKITETVKKLNNLSKVPEPPIDQPIKINQKKE